MSKSQHHTRQLAAQRLGCVSSVDVAEKDYRHRDWQSPARMVARHIGVVLAFSIRSSASAQAVQLIHLLDKILGSQHHQRRINKYNFQAANAHPTPDPARHSPHHRARNHACDNYTHVRKSKDSRWVVTYL